MGNNLVRIIDFSHPLTLLDIQLVKDEMKKRSSDERNITLVSFGKEINIDPHITEYNKLHSINKLEIIELRTDSKYGKIIQHKPPEAEVLISRKGKQSIISIKNYISYLIVQRLDEQTRITDFRQMIDYVLIDTNYNGKVFDVVFSDVPEKNSELVQGQYEITIPESKTIIAIKIVDMLGEELIFTQEI